MDIVNVLGNVADNVLSGRNVSINPFEFEALFDAREDGGTFFLDCRERPSAEALLNAYPGKWHNIPQGQLSRRLDEVPRDKKVVLVCNSGARSYEAFVILAHAGFTNVFNVAGGMSALTNAGVDPKV
jgi:rhodanese-related sulfurtransferase